MKHQLDSSVVRSVEETGRGTMIVEFVKGGRYEFFDVPASVLREFVAAESAGKFFNERIRGQFREEPRT